MPTRKPKSSYQWMPKQPQPTLVDHVSTSTHNWMDNHSQQQAEYSPTRHEKSKWIPKHHTPLSNDLQTHNVASTSHFVLSDLSTKVADTLKQHLSQFSKQDFWFVHENVTERCFQVEQSLGRGEADVLSPRHE